MIITNREEVIDKAFGVFVRMNYEKASIITLAKACGVTKTGIVYYFPHKLDLFMAVADKYVLQMHEPENKFAAPADTLAEFIGQYVAGVAASMKRIV
ncbi:TetR/AcrR family transcriptional regulator, partial [Parabacteroides distasonis]